MSIEHSRLTRELLTTNTKDLIPKSVVDSAKNPDRLDVLPLRGVKGELNFTIIEHNYGGQTDKVTWTQWLSMIKREKEAQGGSIISDVPEAPDGVNRFHARFVSYIETGKLSLQDRIMLTCVLRINESSVQPILVVGEYDGEKGTGFATDFYTNTLPALAKKLGIRIICGQNNGKNISFFTGKLGRYTYRQLKPEYQTKLFPKIKPQISENDFLTVQFLYPEDIYKYVDPLQIVR